MITRILSAITVIIVIISCYPLKSSARPENIILFIGDGMGFEQVKAGGMYANGASGTLSFESFPYQAQLTTYSADSSVTDSAAAATAIATGVKVNNEVISIASPGDNSPLETILEYSKNNGKSTGLVSTAYLTHATPAAFGAHEPSRNNLIEIGSDYFSQSTPNVLLGGGGNGIDNSMAVSAGYTVVTNLSEMQALNTETVSKVSGQFGSSHIPYEFDGVGNLPHLSDMTVTALDILDNDPDGFFLMIEGGRIDHAGHINNIDRNVYETVEFSNAVQEAVNWSVGRTDTLIIVVADHETGGMTVLQNNGQNNLPTVSWATHEHTASDIPAYAWGVNSEIVRNTMDNTELYSIFIIDDAFPEDPNEWLDTDGDGVGDNEDNCVTVANAGVPQPDTDGDDIGDACELDRLCAPIDLQLGFNVRGIPCPPEDYSGYQLLENIGADNGVSVQKFENESGLFDTVSYGSVGQPVGKDFSITPSDGLFIFMKQALTGFKAF